MDLECDLLIVGGGLSGLVAGTVAAEAGLNTIILRKGQSATAYSSGAIDVIGYLPDATEPIVTPLDGLSAIAGLYPQHPYCIVGYDERVESESIVETIIEKTRLAIEWLKSHLETSLSPLVGDFDENIYPITILGTRKPTCLVQKTMDYGDLEKHDDNVLLFVGFSGHPDFNPSAAAKTYLEDRIVSETPPRKVSHCYIDISPFGKSYNLSSIEIARYFDHKGSIEKLDNLLQNHIAQLGVTHIAFPPVLGIRNALQNKLRLEELTSTSVFELLGFPPSVPGQRLQRSLEDVFVKTGGKMLVGFEATSYDRTDARLSAIIASSPRRQIRINSKAFLLATGKFIGGGIVGDETGFHESVFDLMTVTGDYYTADGLTPSRITNRLSLSPTGQPLQYCGLSVDPQFRPIKEDGTEWAENLFASGSILAGYNYSVEKSGLGVATTTGFHSAKSITNYIKEAV